jgi:hypothetical protein
MELGFFLADFFFFNEERGYPQQAGNRGGNLYMDFCHMAVSKGWQTASLELQRMRRNRPNPDDNLS